MAKHVTTFIREPTWVSPTLGMEPHVYTEEEKQAFKEKPDILLEMRKQTEKGMASAFPLLLQGSATQDQTVQYMQQQMKQKINNDELAEKLIPDFAVGCRRLTVSAIQQQQEKLLLTLLSSSLGSTILKA